MSLHTVIQKAYTFFNMATTWVFIGLAFRHNLLQANELTAPTLQIRSNNFIAQTEATADDGHFTSTLS